MNTEELGMYTGTDHIQYSGDHIVNKKSYEVKKIDFTDEINWAEAKLSVIGKIFPKKEPTNDPIVNKVIEMSKQFPNDAEYGAACRKLISNLDKN